MALPRREATHSGAGIKPPARPHFRAFEAEFDYVYRSLLRHGVAPSDAEDLAQDVFLVTWRRWADFDSGRPLRPWLAGIAFKIASEHLRRRRRWEPRAWLDPPDQAPGGEELLAVTRARALAMHCLAALEDAQRSLIVLHDLDGVPMREIAGMLSVPLFTAYSRLRAARRAFSDVVDRERRQASTPAVTLPAATALLDLERSPPAAPAEVRRRSLARLRGLLLMPSGAGAPAAAPGRWPLIALASAVGTSVLLAVAMLNARALPSTPAAPITAAAAVPAAVRTVTKAPPAFVRVPALLPSAAPQPVVHPPKVRLERGLIGHWTFEEEIPGVAWDRSRSNNPCRFQQLYGTGESPAAGGRSVEGISGRALQLDGSQFLTCSRPEPFAHLQTAMSISLWMKPGPPSARPQVLIARQMGSSVQRYFSIALRDGSLELMSHRWRSVTRRPLPPQAGPWIHVVAIHRDNGKTYLFVDGVMVGRSNKSARAHLGGGSNVLTLGGTTAPDGAPFQGVLDEVRIYNRALGQSEVRALASAPPAPADARADDKIALSHQ